MMKSDGRNNYHHHTVNTLDNRYKSELFTA